MGRSWGRSAPGRCRCDPKKIATLRPHGRSRTLMTLIFADPESSDAICVNLRNLRHLRSCDLCVLCGESPPSWTFRRASARASCRTCSFSSPVCIGSGAPGGPCRAQKRVVLVRFVSVLPKHPYSSSVCSALVGSSADFVLMWRNRYNPMSARSLTCTPIFGAPPHTYELSTQAACWLA